MSFSSKITDDEMRYFQFKARQLFLLRKEDHEWNEFCKKNTCTCSSCQPNIVPKMNKEVGIQSFPKNILPSSARSTSSALHPFNKNLPQALSEIKTKLEKIDLALSEMNVTTKNEMKEMIKPKEIFSQRLNTFPREDDMADSVKSIINERKMQLIQGSLKMSLQRLQSAALRNTRPNSKAVIKKKSSGYFIPRDLERQRATARKAYLASLEKTAVQSKALLHSAKEKTNAKMNRLKPKTLKTATKSFLREFNKSNNKKEEESTLVETDNLAETKDENIETAIDAIIDDILGETVLIINKIKQSKPEKSAYVIQNKEHDRDSEYSRNFSVDLDSKGTEAAMIKQFQNKLEIIGQNLHCLREEPGSNKLESVEVKSLTTVAENVIESEKLISPSAHLRNITEIKNTLPVRDLSMDPVKVRKISKCRKDYWNYLEKISHTKKGNFDPWTLSNLVAESLLDDCIQKVAEELQDVPASLIADLYDQEFFESI